MIRLRWILAWTSLVLLAIGRTAEPWQWAIAGASVALVLAGTLLAFASGAGNSRWSPAVASLGLTILLLTPATADHALVAWPWLPGILATLTIAALWADGHSLNAAQWVRSHAPSLALTASIVVLMLATTMILGSLGHDFASTAEADGAYGILLGALPVLAVAVAIAAGTKVMTARPKHHTHQGEDP